VGDGEPFLLRPGAQQKRHRDQGAEEAGVDVGQLVAPLAAGLAAVEVGLDLVAIPGRQLVSDVGAEPVHRVTTVGPGLRLDVGLQIGLPEPFPGPVGQGRHGVGLDADHRADLGRGHAFDLGQPQDRPPALGERPQGLPDEVPLQVGQHDLVGIAGHGDLFGDVVAQIELLGAAVAVDGGVAHAGQQVGPEGQLPVDHPRQGGEDLGEALGHGVLGVGRRAGGGAGHAPGGVVVAEVERPEGTAVPLARLQHQLAVTQQRGAGEIGGSRGVAQIFLGWGAGNGRRVKRPARVSTARGEVCAQQPESLLQPRPPLRIRNLTAVEPDGKAAKCERSLKVPHGRTTPRRDPKSVGLHPQLKVAGRP
jgi:hypothetical protein